MLFRSYESLGIDYKARRISNIARSKRIRKTNGKKFLKKHIWDATDNMFNLNDIMENKDNIFLGVSDFEDLVTSEIMRHRVDANLTTVQRETTVLCNRDTWKHWAEEQFGDCLFIQTNSSSEFIVEQETNNFIKILYIKIKKLDFC